MPLSFAGCLFKSMRNAAVGIITIQKAAESKGSLLKHARLDAFRKQRASRRKPQKWIFFSLFLQTSKQRQPRHFKKPTSFFFFLFFF